MKSMNHLSRRRFLERAAIATGALAAAPALLSGAEPPTKMLIGSQLYGWGQYHGRAGQKLEDHLDEVLSALRDAGYDYAEGPLDVATPETELGWLEKVISPVSARNTTTRRLSMSAEEASRTNG